MEIKELTPKILAYLSDMTQEDAKIKIHVLKERIAGNTERTVRRIREGEDLSISVDLYEKHTGEPIKQAIDSIRKNYLKHQATKSYISDYPTEKLVPTKTGSFPKRAYSNQEIRNSI